MTRGRTRKPVKKLDRSRNCASNSPEILVLSHFLTDSSFYLDPIFTGDQEAVSARISETETVWYTYMSRYGDTSCIGHHSFVCKLFFDVLCGIVATVAKCGIPKSSGPR